jgi:uncharacterized lipoprotein YddW (UPF0748 family)
MPIFKFLKQIIYLTLIILVSTSTLRGDIETARESGTATRLGIWITVFTNQNVLDSTSNIDRLINDCAECGVTDIYLQVYRANKAYYDSDIADDTNYLRIMDKTGLDPINYLIDKANEPGIKIHAWLNVLSIAKNEQAHIFEKYGQDVLTYDQYGNTSLHVTKGFIPEHQLFLEPGDYRVREYTGNIVKEILTKYPEFSGIHLDYIRYPSSLPYIPGARFTNQGISYGYNRFNILNFQKATGLDPRTMDISRENAYLWDNWRRDQVTKLVKYISRQAKSVTPRAEISCAVVPSIEKAYLVTFQNWPEWLRENIVDFIVFMNYTDNKDYMKIRAESVLFPDLKNKLQIGLGAYLMKKDKENLEQQILYAKNLCPQGIVIFSYDDIAAHKELKDFLGNTFTPARQSAPSLRNDADMRR